ncbi:Ubiquitin-conjugating enzyme E2 C [Trichoplax sp. H2]|uniref:Ubiquitin-conjugating enzyme E2 C n=1 Tax=Trichoplax adhaerens TaxID=10228 RepID=B3RV97_TRIAD|nr:hypothetical protein TRIADDRAFT_55577 [Trichoplax adhaerens]EDV25464.1 hypothetical protein TRIADDRAFT_55577 [Trichoplax adhaerens]RDD44145.1 Ubiquitin-conjugating enzyme E2 C [Trichoplax sp. H2]|eukprot:XP_002111497.1 hypothetical protein TRIADDRAFT_55577 [Trichoplax adhaerens]
MSTQNRNPSHNSDAKKTGEATKTSLKDGSSVTKRLQRELMTLMMSGDYGISAFPDNNNMFRWIGTIIGAKGTVYDSLEYKLTLEFPSGYPYKAPTIRFETPCYHPNVDQWGNICLDILKEEWSALYDVRSILVSLQSLLGEPNVKSPLNTQAASLWENQEEYKKVLLEKYRSATSQSKSK